MRQKTRRTIAGYCFVAPWLAALVFLIGFPFTASLFFSTCDYPPLREPVFVGMENYTELAGDPSFRMSMTVTIAFAVVAIPLGVLVALSLALLLNSRIRGRSIYRVVYYLPHLVPTVAVAILWLWMFNPQFGILNVLIEPFGKAAAWILQPFAAADVPLPGWLGLPAVIGTFALWRHVKGKLTRIRPSQTDRVTESALRAASRVAGLACLAAALLALAMWLDPIDLRKMQSPGWLTDANPFPSGLSLAPSWALWALIYMSVWGAGQMAVIYLAKLQDVPAELYEAAELDGAGWWQKTRYVTLPMISPVILFNVIMGIIGAFQVFAEPYIMTAGGPADRTRFIAMFIYDQAFQYQRLGYASAVAWVLFLLIAALTLLALRVGRERIYYAAR